jgi:hypothetical protein
MIDSTRPETAAARSGSGQREAGEPPGWLAECDGFLVESEGGRVGVVAGAGVEDDPRRSAYLLVRLGMLGRRVVSVPAADVEAILPAGRRVLLRRGWTPSSDPLPAR